MAKIEQTARIELERQIARHAGVVRGHVLDVGASSHLRYRKLFLCDDYKTLDVKAGEGIDMVGRAEALPCESGSFDSIVCTQVLGDVYDVQKAFAEFYRVLAPGGVALITEAFIDPLHAEPNDFWRFTAHSFRRLAEDAGFAVEVLERRGGVLERHGADAHALLYRAICALRALVSEAFQLGCAYVRNVYALARSHGHKPREHPFYPRISARCPQT